MEVGGGVGRLGGTISGNEGGFENHRLVGGFANEATNALPRNIAPRTELVAPLREWMGLVARAAVSATAASVN